MSTTPDQQIQNAEKNCPCGSGLTYEACCEPFHKGESTPETPEALMRSRYCAFVKKEYDYLEETLDPQTITDFDHAGNRAWADSVNLYKLEILRSEQSGTKGLVEFKAYYTENQTENIHHEISKFRKQAGTWYFREGKVLPQLQKS